MKTHIYIHIQIHNKYLLIISILYYYYNIYICSIKFSFIIYIFFKYNISITDIIHFLL